MTRAPDRLRLMTIVQEAIAAGARLSEACQSIGLSERTLQRWGKGSHDRRPTASRPAPKNKLSAEEEQQVLAICHEPRFASLPPAQIVPLLADEERYIASESTFYRILRRSGETTHRGRQKQATIDLEGNCTESGVVMGYHLVEVGDSRTLVLSVPDRRRVQPQNRRLRGSPG